MTKLLYCLNPESRFWKASSVRIAQPSQQRSTDQKIMRCIDPGPSKKRSTAKRWSERPKALLIHASRTGLWAFWHVTRQVVIWHVLSCRATEYQGFFYVINRTTGKVGPLVKCDQSISKLRESGTYWDYKQLFISHHWPQKLWWERRLRPTMDQGSPWNVDHTVAVPTKKIDMWFPWQLDVACYPSNPILTIIYSSYFNVSIYRFRGTQHDFLFLLPNLPESTWTPNSQFLPAVLCEWKDMTTSTGSSLRRWSGKRRSPPEYLGIVAVGAQGGALGVVDGGHMGSIANLRGKIHRKNPYLYIHDHLCTFLHTGLILFQSAWFLWWNAGERIKILTNHTTTLADFWMETSRLEALELKQNISCVDHSSGHLPFGTILTILTRRKNKLLLVMLMFVIFPDVSFNWWKE